MTKNIYRVRRSLINDALLRPLGQIYSGLELAETGLGLFGLSRKHVPFANLTGPVKVSKFLGFTAVFLRLQNGEEIRIAGLKSREAESFATAANDAFRQNIARQFTEAEQEFRKLCELLIRLHRPRRYPSACVLNPFLERAENIVSVFPFFIPDGTLTVEQGELLKIVKRFSETPQRIRDEAIKNFTESELVEMKEFFDTIESNPLTSEQRRAVVIDEDATLILAGAGSGKTSVIVAKAAYLITRGIRRPEEILLMAFGKDAANEMAERIAKRSGAAVDAMTFHALGNRIIREVEGKGPVLADHADDDAKFRVLLKDILLTEITKKANLKSILLNWFSEFFWPYKNEWDFKSKAKYFEWIEAHELRTLNGDRVKSHEEWEIGNWLFLNGIEYEYEPVYEHELPDNKRGAYKPDFRLTESGIYIEHFGVRKAKDSSGKTYLTTAPYIDRKRYLEGMAWKRKVHNENGTTLIETFSYENVEGRLLEALEEKLTPYVEIKPIPEDQVFSTLTEMGQIDQFTQILGTFLRHYKSSNLSINQCKAISDNLENKRRHFAFLKIFEPLFEAYQQRMGDKIDFEDMINRAAEHVQAGRYKSPYRHLLVDEFQDISEGRARLLKALKAQHSDARIFAVGDDWQSIFRFAGSDIHLMRDFGTEFGGDFGNDRGIHSVVDLGRTFRSVDRIALPARRFILKNPAQIEKKVKTIATSNVPAIMVFYYNHSRVSAALAEVLAQLSEMAASGGSVLLLGRYNYLRPKNMKDLKAKFPKLSLKFKTAHGSKGLEADHVVILRASSGAMGFPSEITDDPLLDLVLPKSENFDHAEERRLFYVALTRARKSVAILADREKPSEFVRELSDDPEYQILTFDESSGSKVYKCPDCGGRMLAKTGKGNRIYFSCEHRKLCGKTLLPCQVCGSDLPIKDAKNPENMICCCGAEHQACPECTDGWLVERRGKFGKFLGCINYPSCRGRGKFPDSGAGRYRH
ncbi:UvrD-helicase domain-containing protein [Sneathiella sp. HT1-7]|uniref:UvrD-helicase domain-containing protein n=1 Tax=Sneathiella sp. HT1-7 TaxID=2887192 RepID=UPI001D144724|nr:UvrD-helicase domain-containing protein [Sneathiella sp. HT1-7]MCC3306036.1 UvrD-helicase domain-containing protein [Sneathiella sp. HT1-7]